MMGLRVVFAGATLVTRKRRRMQNAKIRGWRRIMTILTQCTGRLIVLEK
jgi:hypothetical protein